MPGNFHTVNAQDISTWPTPNYTNPLERTWLPGFAIFWEVLSTLFVGGRLYVRIRNQSGSFGYDDALIFIAWGFATAFTAIACISVWDWDIGRHIWDVRPDRYEGALYYAWVAQVLFIHSTGAAKTSILLFYRRMTKNTYSKGWLYTVWVLLFITVASWISMFIVWCKMCTPLTTYWLIHEMEAIGDGLYTCLNGDAITIAAGVLTILSDFWSAALPCVLLSTRDLGISRRQRIALNVVFCLGFLVTGVGVARTYYLWEIGQDEDLSWIGYDLFASSVVECQLAIICCCAPFLRALVRRYLPDFTHQSRSRGTVTVTETNTNDRFSHAEDSSMDRIYNRPPDVQLESMNEKKGFLVVENGTGRAVWHNSPDE